jgi:MFS family permease
VISGTFADRYDRRWMLLWTQVLLGLLSLRPAFSITSATSSLDMPHFTFLSATVGAFDGPARQAMFPSLVPRWHYLMRWRSPTLEGSALIGPSLGGRQRWARPAFTPMP